MIRLVRLMAMRRATALLAVGTVACIATLAGSGYASGSGVTRCQIAHTRLSVSQPVSEATGQNTVSVVLTNRLSRSCTLKGYPTIGLLDRSSRRLSFTYSHRGDLMITSKKPAEVRVPAGGSALFLFNKYRCDIRALDTARTLRLALPGSDVVRSVGLPRDSHIDYCRQSASLTVAVSPIERHLQNALSH